MSLSPWKPWHSMNVELFWLANLCPQSLTSVKGSHSGSACIHVLGFRFDSDSDKAAALVMLDTAHIEKRKQSDLQNIDRAAEE